MGLCKQGISSEACPSRTFSYYKLITFRKALGEKNTTMCPLYKHKREEMFNKGTERKS